MSEEYQGGEDLGVFVEAKLKAREEYKGKKLLDLVKLMKSYGEQKADLETQLKVVNANYDVLRLELIPERMEEDGVERIAFEGIGRVSITADVLVNIKGGMKEDLFSWFKKRKLDSLIQPTVNSSTLKAFVKRCIQDGKEYPVDLLNITPISRAAITKK